MIRKAPGYYVAEDSSLTKYTGRVWYGVRKPSRSRYSTDARVCEIDRERYYQVQRAPAKAVPLGVAEGRSYWWYEGQVYVTDELDLTGEDVQALLDEQTNRKRLRLQQAHDLQAMARQLDKRGKRQTIPRAVKTEVWRQCEGKCVTCGAFEDLQYDHIIPLAMGGSNTAQNLQLLCASCNRRKGPTLGGEEPLARIVPESRQTTPGPTSLLVMECPHCGKPNRVPPRRTVSCGHCSRTFRTD